MKPEIYPGILTHNLEEYVARLEMVEASPSSWAHIDFADGQFVPNITVMPHEIMSISTRLNLEAHMMTFAPERYYSDLTVAGVSRVLLHREAFDSLESCAQALKEAGNYFPEVGLVINPDTEVESYQNLPIKVLMHMGIHPGFSGQPFLEATYDTIDKVGKQKLNVVRAIDGGVTEENITELQKRGIQRFIVTSHLFASNNLVQNFQYFNQLLGGI
jgi:ribulose-phosphate 3-epimerase